MTLDSIDLEQTGSLKKPEFSYQFTPSSQSESLKLLALKPESVKGKKQTATEVTQPSRYIPAAVKKELLLRSGGQCEFYDSTTDRRCLCRTHLEVEHSTPYAKGGANTLENLKIYCANHNRWTAVQAFGAEMMGHYYQN